MIGEIPSWLLTSLSLDEANRIEAAVKAAEARTSAEIVPMIVHRSTLKGTGDRILFWICFAFLGIGGAVSFSLASGLDEALLEHLIRSLGVWPTATVHTALVIAIEIFLAMAAFGVAWLASKWLAQFDVIHRLVFPVSDLALEAENRARSEFNATDLRSTTGRTGVLLFVSMLEHRAVILADEAIAKKIDQSVWNETLWRLLGAIRNGQMGQGYVDAVNSIAKCLEPHFPPLTSDVNELSDRLRIIE